MSEEEELEERLEEVEERLDILEAVVKKYARQQGVDVEAIEEQIRESGSGGDN